MTTTRVLLVDDHELVRAGFRALLYEIGVEVVAEASDGNEALSLINSFQPDVVFMDISMPSLNGLEATARIVKEYPKVSVIILSMYANPEYVQRTLRAGALGYLLKNSSPCELNLSIKAAAKGETYLSPAITKFIVADYVHGRRSQPNLLEQLSPRQREILHLIASGMTRKQIAEKLNISDKTFDTYRTRLMEQLNIHDSVGLMRYAAQMDLSTDQEV
jgi:DNA-binding NarL/FixJ family response regulator